MKIVLNKAHAKIAAKRDAKNVRSFGAFFSFLFAFSFLAWLFSPVAAFAQGYPLPNNTPFTGHYIAACSTPPTLVGGTLAAGSCDTDGEFTASAASGSLTFGTAFTAKPSCSLVDQTATPIAVWANTPTAITLTTITSAHLYTYHCAAKIGG